MWHRPCRLLFVITSVYVLDDKLASRKVGDNASYLDASSTDHFVTESNSCVRQDKAIAPQQEDSGRSGGSGDSAGSSHARSITSLACVLMKYIPNSDKITTITNLIDSANIILAS